MFQEGDSSNRQKIDGSLLSQPAFTCSKLTMETLNTIVNFEHISHLVLVFLLLTLSK